MVSNRDVRIAGVRHVCDELSRLNWKIESIMEGRNELHVTERRDITWTLKIRTLTREAPVPFPQGLGILDRINYLIICNNLQGRPNLIVIKPQTVRKVIHKDTKNDDVYWLQPLAYNKHGLDFEREFGDGEPTHQSRDAPDATAIMHPSSHQLVKIFRDA